MRTRNSNKTHGHSSNNVGEWNLRWIYTVNTFQQFMASRNGHFIMKWDDFPVLNLPNFTESVEKALTRQIYQRTKNVIKSISARKLDGNSSTFSLIWFMIKRNAFDMKAATIFFLHFPSLELQWNVCFIHSVSPISPFDSIV